MLFVFHAAFPLQDWSSAGDLQLKQALKRSQLTPTAPSLLFLHQVREAILSPFYSPPKGDLTTPSLSLTMSLWRAVGLTPGLRASLGAVAKMDGLTTQPWGHIRYLIALHFITIPFPDNRGFTMQLWWCRVTTASSSLAAMSAAGSLTLVRLWKVSIKHCDVHIANDNDYRQEAVSPSKWWTWNLCSRLQSEWVCHDWGLQWQWLSWESGQVSHHNYNDHH